MERWYFIFKLVFTNYFFSMFTQGRNMRPKIPIFKLQGPILMTLIKGLMVFRFCSHYVNEDRNACNFCNTTVAKLFVKYIKRPPKDCALDRLILMSRTTLIISHVMTRLVEGLPIIIMKITH